ncbi:MAG: PLP-dependent cysteine synthase family protein [Treponema sp.]|jgi:cysteine synthase B|nr:PLP-dependent cysteine synthase family protein [Treponema sp.]
MGLMMNILDLVGNTPLLALKKISQDIPGVSLFAKAEFCNPSGSVKDRAAKAMILAGLEQGALVPGKTIIDATSGNTGIAYSMIGAALGYPVLIYLPANASTERKRIMKSYHARIVETSPLESSDGAFLAVQEAVAGDPDRYFFPNQYNNDTNWKAHYNSTGIEIWEQTGGGVTHFISGLGTSGTFMGISRRLKGYSEDIHVYAIQPDSPFHGIEGTKHMGSTIKPGIYDETLPEGFVEVSTDAAYAMTRRLAREEGIFAGISSGANVAGAVQLGKTLPKDSVVVTVLGDSGCRYLSDNFWGEGGES